jgi:hypothetical protein
MSGRGARRIGAIVAGLALVAAGAALPILARAPRADAAGLNLRLVWSRSLPHVSFLESSPVPANLSTPAVVVGALDGKVYAFDMGTGADEPGWPAQTSNPVNSSPAAADVVGDGHDRVFVGSGQAANTVAGACSGGGTYAFEPTGAVRWHNIGSDAACPNEAFHSSFAIGDITGDTLPDATIGSLGLVAPSYTAASGVINPGWPFFTDDTVFSSPALANVTNGGLPDVIMGGDATPGPSNFRGGMVRAIDGTGHLIWQFNVDEQVRSSPAIGDLDGSGQPSIAFGTGNFWLTHGGSQDATSVFVLNESGQLKWRKDLGGLTLAGPALADVAGTGHPDIVEGTAGTPANPNSGLIWVLDGNGNPLPNWAGRATVGGVIIGGISTADLTGSGYQDLLVPTGDGVFIYDGRTAQQIGTIGLGQIGFQNNPLITDDGGGNVGITVAGTQPDGTGVVEHWSAAGGQLGAISWPMFHHDPHHTGNLMALPTGTMPCVAGSGLTPPSGKVGRLAGANRDATAEAVSRAEFPTAGSAKTVVVASDADFPDALAGGPLAAANGGPLLITPPGGLPSDVTAEIRRVLPTGGKVYVLGGPQAVSATVDGQLQSGGYQETRLQGSDRYGTATAIAGAMGSPSTVLEVTGIGFADALAAGPAAASTNGAILLTNGSVQAPATAAYLGAHPGTRYAVGGPAAQADPSATPIAGPDRYATALAVAGSFFTAPTTLGFAVGTGFADALSGGAALGKTGPLLLVPPCGGLATGLTGFVSAVKGGVQTATLFGGPRAVGDDVLSQLDAALA